jgi:hypothetical protein
MIFMLVFKPVTRTRSTNRTQTNTTCETATAPATKLREHRPCEPKRAESVLQKHKAAPQTPAPEPRHAQAVHTCQALTWGISNDRRQPRGESLPPLRASLPSHLQRAPARNAQISVHAERCKGGSSAVRIHATFSATCGPLNAS